MSQTPTIDTAETAEAVDLYREVHKGLRLALFELVESAGALDPSDPDTVDAFTRLFADVDMMLETHHAHEDGSELGALIEQHASAAAATVEEAHDDFVRRMTELRSAIAQLSDGIDNSAAIYDSLTMFTSTYLAHMAVEENQVMPALQQAVPNEDLMAITMAIRTSVPPPDMCVFLRYMLPAMSPDERTATLAGMKAGAPPEIFDLFWSVAEASLSGPDLATVAGRITA